MRTTIVSLLLCTAISCIAADSAVIPFTENAIVVKNTLVPSRPVASGAAPAVDVGTPYAWWKV